MTSRKILNQQRLLRARLQASAEALDATESDVRLQIDLLEAALQARALALLAYEEARDACVDLPEGEEVALTGGDAWEVQDILSEVRGLAASRIYRYDLDPEDFVYEDPLFTEEA